MKIEIYIYRRKMENFYKKAMEEYQKRLGRYVTIGYKFVRKEKEWMDYCIQKGEKYYLMEGKSISSEEFSRVLEKAEISGKKRVVFLISEKEWSEKNSSWIQENLPNHFSLSEFTMSAPMQALILYEQIYRGYRIMHHHPYHK